MRAVTMRMTSTNLTGSDLVLPRPWTPIPDLLRAQPGSPSQHTPHQSDGAGNGTEASPFTGPPQEQSALGGGECE